MYNVVSLTFILNFVFDKKISVHITTSINGIMYKQEYIEVSIQPCTDSFYFCFLVFEITKFGFCRMLKQQQKTSVKITTYKTDFESQTNIF